MLRFFAQNWFDLTPIDSVCVISKQSESLRFRLAQRTPNSFIVRQKGRGLVGARCGIVRHRRCLNPRVPRSTPSAYSRRGLSESKATHLPRVAAASISASFATSLQRDLRETLAHQAQLSAEFHGTRCYVAWGRNSRGRLFRLCSEDAPGSQS